MFSLRSLDILLEGKGGLRFADNGMGRLKKTNRFEKCARVHLLEDDLKIKRGVPQRPTTSLTPSGKTLLAASTILV